jgi:hypothetical protein
MAGQASKLKRKKAEQRRILGRGVGEETNIRESGRERRMRNRNKRQRPETSAATMEGRKQKGRQRMRCCRLTRDQAGCWVMVVVVGGMMGRKEKKRASLCGFI